MADGPIFWSGRARRDAVQLLEPIPCLDQISATGPPSSGKRDAQMPHGESAAPISGVHLIERAPAPLA
jgi:hypothetical protein